MGHSEDDAVYKIPHEMKMHQLTESAENFSIGLILDLLWNYMKRY